MIDWGKEGIMITIVANQYGVDPYFIAAIRGAENGGVGIEFGVEDENADNYEAQLDECCATVRNFIIKFYGTIYEEIRSTTLIHSRLMYTTGFREAFSRQWAPVGAENDPTNLNTNWFNNNSMYYKKFCEQGEIA